MPSANNKADLIAVTIKEFAKLQALLAQLPPEFALLKEDDISIKDVLAHRAHWIDLFLGWHADVQAGRHVHIPAIGYKWNQLADYNAALRVRQMDMGWDAAWGVLRRAHAALGDFLDDTSDLALYGAPVKGTGSKWSTGRFAEAAGASHYRSASKYIRARLRTSE